MTATLELFIWQSQSGSMLLVRAAGCANAATLSWRENSVYWHFALASLWNI